MKQQLQTHFTTAPTALEFRTLLRKERESICSSVGMTGTILLKDIAASALLWELSCKYDDFLSQPPKLGLYVPVGENGEVLSKPEKYHLFERGITNGETTEWIRRCEEYQKALSKVIFKGFEVNHKTYQAVVFTNNFSFRIDQNAIYSGDHIPSLNIAQCAGLEITPNYFNFLDT